MTNIYWDGMPSLQLLGGLPEPVPCTLSFFLQLSAGASVLLRVSADYKT